MANNFWTYEEGIKAGIYDPGTSATSPIKTDSMTVFGSNGAAPSPPITPTAPGFSPLTGTGNAGSTYIGSTGATAVPGGTVGGGNAATFSGEVAGLPVSGALQLPGWADSLSNYFVRAVIIILGLIFVAAGLWLTEKNPQPILPTREGGT